MPKGTPKHHSPASTQHTLVAPVILPHLGPGFLKNPPMLKTSPMDILNHPTPHPELPVFLKTPNTHTHAHSHTHTRTQWVT